MKLILLTLFVIFAVANVGGQGSRSSVDLVTVFSQNELFYLRSWPFDNEFPTTRGETQVFSKDSSKPIYSLSRGFDSVDEESNNLVLSNDGEVIFYLIPWGEDEDSEELKSISIYRRGQLIRSYTASEITGCDLSKERCELEYSNYAEVVDKEKSNWGSKDYKKAFKTGISEQEKFLSNYSLFSFDDIVYLTDSKKNVHQFNLKDGKHVGTAPFSAIFDEIKGKGRFNRAILLQYDAPTFLDFPKLRTGLDTANALATTLGMRTVKNFGPGSDKYKTYGFKVSGFLERDGSFKVEELELPDDLPEKPIRDFFAGKKFASKAIPSVFKKWWIEEYFFVRKADDEVALRERREQLKAQRADLQKRLVAETIEGSYIPKDLKDSFIALDKELSEINKKEMTALTTRKDMIVYHMGLGRWMRNNWGLWGGSRLQKYFTDKGIRHPEEMSTVILFFYWDWLQGDQSAWQEWEKDPQQEIL